MRKNITINEIAFKLMDDNIQLSLSISNEYNLK